MWIHTIDHVVYACEWLRLCAAQLAIVIFIGRARNWKNERHFYFSFCFRSHFINGGWEPAAEQRLNTRANLWMFSLWYRSMCSNHSVIVAYNWYLNFWADNSHIYEWHKQLTCYCPRAQNVFFLSIDYRYSVQEFIDIWPEAHNLLLFAKYTHQVS